MENSELWDTKRQKLIKTLKNSNVYIDLRSLMREFEYTSKKNLIRDIISIMKTLRNEYSQLTILPPSCNSCSYVFKLKKNDLKIPSKCPRCKKQRINWPQIKIA